MAKYYVGKKSGIVGDYALFKERSSILPSDNGRIGLFELETTKDVEDLAVRTAKLLWEERNPSSIISVGQDFLMTQFGELLLYPKLEGNSYNMGLSKLVQLDKSKLETFESSLVKQIWEYVNKVPEAIKDVVNQ